MTNEPGFEPDVLRQLRAELPDLVGAEAAAELGERLGHLAEQLERAPGDLQTERESRALIMEYDPLHRRWLELSSGAGMMDAKRLFGDVEPPMAVRYCCTKDAGHEFDEADVARDVLNQPICPVCGAVMKVA